MKKLKVYLDTSVISYLKQEDSPERMRDTIALWKMFELGDYEVFLSNITLDEVGKCSEPKRSFMIGQLGRISYSKIPLTEETVKLAEKIISLGILPKKSMYDSLHIAAAVMGECDCIISWNFKHIVNIETIRGVRAITNLDGYRTIEILSPDVLLDHSGDKEVWEV